MCDYSLHHVGSRPAKANDKLIATVLTKSRTRGFAAVGEVGAKLVIDDAPPKVAVCLLPGTELAFDDYVRFDRAFSLFGKVRINHKLARFRQIDRVDARVHYDALEFSDGQILKVSQLVVGQTARVLQLPVTTPHSEHHQEHFETRRIGRLSDSRIALNRMTFRPGMASILMPSQNTAMLWDTFRRTMARILTALEQSFRSLNAHKPLPREADTAQFEVSFKNDAVAVTQQKTRAAHEVEKTIEVKTLG